MSLLNIKDNIYMESSLVNFAENNAVSDYKNPLIKILNGGESNDSKSILKGGKSKDLDVESIFKLIDLYYKQKYVMYSHLHNSFDKFLDDNIKSLLENGENVFFEKMTKDKIYRYKFKYDDISVKPPMIDTEDELLYPSEARTRNLTYASKLVAKVTQLQEIEDIETGEKVIKQIGTPEFEYPLATIPIMVKSKYCSLNLKKGKDRKECDVDPGGYFIVKGSEKVVLSLEKKADNKPMVSTKKEGNALIYSVQVNSKAQDSINEMIQIIGIRMKKDNYITLKAHILNEVPIFIVFRALGVETDKAIIDMIAYDDKDTDMVNLLRLAMENSIPEDSPNKIMTKEEAYNYLIQKIRVPKRYSETDAELRIKQKKLHLETLLKNNFIPHMENDPIKKAYYLGYMINRLLQCYLGRIPTDDRDSYVNKRVDLPGNLLFELFKQYYKKMLNECNKFFKKRNSDDMDPINVINQIKPSVIELGLNAALLTGNWGKKKGVAQMLQRLTVLQTLSSLRRINSTSVDTATNKLTSPRHLHGTQIGFICVTGDTEIKLSNGQVKQIKDLKGDESVVTVNRQLLNDSNSSFYNYFSRNPDKVLQITTVNGRTIKCDPQHPFMVQENNEIIWKNAGDLNENDFVVIKHTPKNSKRRTNCDKRNIFYNAKSNIAMRIFGAIYSSEKDANDNNYYEIHVNNYIDTDHVLDDLNKICISKYIIENKTECRKIKIKISRDTFNDNVSSYYRTLLGPLLVVSELSDKIEFINGMLTNVNSRLDFKNSVISLTPIEIEDHLIMKQVIKTLDDLGIKSRSSDGKLMIDNEINNVIKFIDTFEYCYNSECKNNDSLNIELIKYQHNNNDNNYIDCIKKCDGENDKVLVKIKCIQQVENELVYDFTTNHNNHSFVGNSFCISNCPVETPEGHKVGLVKNLSMMGGISIMLPSQINIIKKYLNEKVIDLHDMEYGALKSQVRVLLNGEWLGITKNPVKLYNELKKMKLNGTIDINTSITYEIKSEIESNELKIYCDGGRLIRPVLRVVDNELVLNKGHIDLISLDGPRSATNITEWREFLVKHPGVIEYIDVDENVNSMIAMMPSNISEMKDKETNSIDLIKNIDIKQNISVVNRYNDLVFLRYTHCEIHPSMLIGSTASNIPFCNHNQGPRNMFQYSQARQAMGIYISNYRDRLDISYILYQSQRPLVTTRSMKYIGTLELPSGENIIVALACYTGYNQEDSVILNQSGIDRGLFRATSLKKYQTKIEKNQSTSRDDIFIKPDRNKVAGMRHGTYDKLNEFGYAPVETKLEHGDIILGKVSPIQPVGTGNKTFKDNSEVYKSYLTGYVDRVWTGIYDHEGYEMRKMRVRTERIPFIGDKMCCFDDSHDVLTNKGWIKINKLNKDIHLVASLVNNQLKYQNILELQEYHYEGKMYTLETEQISLNVTPNHRMYIALENSQGTGEYSIKKAEEIYGKQSKYLKNVSDFEPDFDKIPNEIQLNSDNKLINYLVYDNQDNIKYSFEINYWLIILGLWLDDGSINLDQVIFSINNPKAKNAFVYACKNLKLEYNNCEDHNVDAETVFSLSSCDIAKTFESLYESQISKNKYIPQWVWFLSKTQCRILMNTMLLNNRQYFKDTSTTSFDTSSTRLRDDFQKLALHAGYSADYYLKSEKSSNTTTNTNNSRSDTPRGNAFYRVAWRITISNQNNPLANYGSTQSDKWTDFKGQVYCCSVPGEGIIYVRRNGKSIWSGNSRAGQKGTIGIKLKASDMPFTKNGLSPDMVVNPNAIF